MLRQSPIQEALPETAQALVEHGRNYQLYQVPTRPRVFVVVGAGADPRPYEEQGFQPASIAGKLVPLLAQPEGGAPRLLVHIHGYSNSSPIVARGIRHLTTAMGFGPDESEETVGNCVWVTYDWPGEAAFRGSALLRGLLTLGTLLFGLALWIGPLLLLWWQLSLPWDIVRIAGIALIYPLLFALFVLRIVSYHRDRYMALHRGVPDLCEFLRHLDYYCAHRGEASPLVVRLSIIAHSMGCMLTLNAVRTLSNLFGRAPDEQPDEKLGESLRLETLVLAAPDVPLELLLVSQNNYFHSAMRRFGRMYIFANVHDAVLRVLSWLVNSFSEPQPGNSRYRLGNVFHRRRVDDPPTSDLSLRPWFFTRSAFKLRMPPVTPDDQRRLELYELLTERVSFIDCSYRPRMGAWLRWSARYPPLRDFLSLLAYTWTHSGYFADEIVLQKMRKALIGELKKGEPGNAVL